MKKLSCCFIVFISVLCHSQSMRTRLAAAVEKFVADLQLKHGLMSLLVIDSRTGKVIIDKNSQLGLSPGSTQKLLTSVAALDILGKDFRYGTEISYDGKIENGVLKGNLFIIGSGDPTFGSWRWNETKQESVFAEIMASLEKNHIKSITGDVYVDDSKFSLQPISGGWIWEDVGNYYGAGTWAINWHENQYDLILKPGNNAGEEVSIIKTDPELRTFQLFNHIRTGIKGSGDNAYIYFPPYSQFGFSEGTIPAGDSAFTISGSIPDGPAHFSYELEKKFQENNILVQMPFKIYHQSANHSNWPHPANVILTHYSPALDTINYWFLKKSINLYGEALIKTIAYQKVSVGATEQGVEVVKDFWQQRGIEPSSINISDGSGLSPQNRITTNALVNVLKYARTRPWYESFYNALPVINGMKMKSGTIGGCLSYAGYQATKGNGYIFAIIVNNYNGPSSSVVKKMWQVLDQLK